MFEVHSQQLNSTLSRKIAEIKCIDVPTVTAKDRWRAFNRKNRRAYASWIACLFRFIALVLICIFLDCMSCLFRFSALVLDCIFAKLIHVFSQGDDGLGDDVTVELPAPMPVGRVGGGSVLWQIFFFDFPLVSGLIVLWFFF